MRAIGLVPCAALAAMLLAAGCDAGKGVTSGAGDDTFEGDAGQSDAKVVESDAGPDARPDAEPDAGQDAGPNVTPQGALPTIGGCQIFPADNPWNTDISKLPVHPQSDAFIDSIGRTGTLHPDFGTEWEGAPNGVPYLTVGADQAMTPMQFTWDDESEPGPYPVPLDAPVEGGPDGEGDRHVIVVSSATCTLYELYNAWPEDDGSWSADAGAVFDLSSNALRPAGWTSADAAGLPILPGLVRYDEVAAGAIRHALRFTVNQSQRGYIAPATHAASDNTEPSLPPMGLRLRMKAATDCSGLPKEVQVICTALKTYGMFVADNGSDWYLSGAPDARWSDEALHELGTIPGDAFEVVDTGPVTPY